MQLLHFTEDPLERFSQEAVNSVLRLSCEDLRYYDYMCWETVIESVREGKPLFRMRRILQQKLMECTPDQIRNLCSGAVSSFAFRPKTGMTGYKLPDYLMRTYLLQHKNTAYRYGVESATQVFGITFSESSSILNLCGFMEGFPIESYRMVLRCSERTIIELLSLDKSKVAKVKEVRLRKIQECLSEDGTTSPEYALPNFVVAYDAATDEGRANIDASKKLLARMMYIQGYTTHAVSVELGLTLRQCRHIAEHAMAAKYLDGIPSSSVSAGDVLKSMASSNSSKSTKTCRHLLRCKETVANASLFMRLYISLGGKRTRTATQVSQITRAYGLYCAARHDVYGLAERSSKKRLTIQDAWILAVDYRSYRSYLDRCKHCGSDIFRSTIQSHESCECPFCS